MANDRMIFCKNEIRWLASRVQLQNLPYRTDDNKTVLLHITIYSYQRNKRK